MKVITVHRPMAWAIVTGYKTTENRSWAISYRGPLLIHAGRANPQEQHDMLATLGLMVPDEFPGGAIVGIVTVTDCVTISEAAARMDREGPNPWVTGPYCWLLADAIAFEEPIVWCGQRGLLPASSRLLGQVRRSLVGTAYSSTSRV